MLRIFCVPVSCWSLVLLPVLMSTGCSQVKKQNRENQVISKIQEHNEVWSYCYKKALGKEKIKLNGEVQMSWRVDYLRGQERVSNITVDRSEVKSEELVNCMKNAIARTRFDLPRDQGQAVYEIRHPFVFKYNKDLSVLKK